MDNYIKQDSFNFLLEEANIGFYNKCEVIEIFGFHIIKKEIFNIYTLIIFENTKQKNIDEMLTGTSPIN